MLYYRINNKSYIERVIFVREPNTEEMTMSKFYAQSGETFPMCWIGWRI